MVNCYLCHKPIKVSTERHLFDEKLKKRMHVRCFAGPCPICDTAVAKWNAVKDGNDVYHKGCWRGATLKKRAKENPTHMKRARDKQSRMWLWHSKDGGKLYECSQSPHYYLCDICQDFVGANSVSATWENESPGADVPDEDEFKTNPPAGERWLTEEELQENPEFPVAVVNPIKSVIYHGTSSEKLPQILKEGLKVSMAPTHEYTTHPSGKSKYAKRRFSQGIFATRDRGRVIGYALSASRRATWDQFHKWFDENYDALYDEKRRITAKEIDQYYGDPERAVVLQILDLPKGSKLGPDGYGDLMIDADVPSELIQVVERETVRGWPEYRKALQAWEEQHDFGQDSVPRENIAPLVVAGVMAAAPVVAKEAPKVAKSAGKVVKQVTKRKNVAPLIGAAVPLVKEEMRLKKAGLDSAKSMGIKFGKQLRKMRENPRAVRDISPPKFDVSKVRNYYLVASNGAIIARGSGSPTDAEAHRLRLHREDDLNTRVIWPDDLYSAAVDAKSLLG